MTKTILLADDERHIRSLVKTTLIDPRFRIVEAVDGGEALERAREHAPDLLIIDLMMPKISGVELARLVRLDPAMATTPIIMLTAVASEDGGNAARAAGISAYLVKPFSPLELLERVESLLGLDYVV
ncbi:MAG: response regulator [Myxococcota bacterium]